MSLEEDVDKVIRDAVLTTSIGMAAWVSQMEGVKEQALPREGETEIDALRRIFQATRDLMLGMLTGQHEAIRLLARQIDALRDVRD